MSAIQDTDLDAHIRAAFEALESTVPEDYFDGFETRLQARLEQELMTENSNQIDTDAELGTAAGESLVAAASADSDLSDIRSLAAKTKESVSQRVLAIESPADEPLISSITLALKTISLPEPGKDSKTFAAGNSAKLSAAVATRDDEGRLPTWIWAAISAALAAAIVFFLVRGDKREDTTRVALSEPSGSAMSGSQSYPGTARTPPMTTNDPLDTPSGARHPTAPGTIGSTDSATDNDSDVEGDAIATAGAASAGMAPKTNARPTSDNTPGTNATTTTGKGARTRAGTRANASATKDNKTASPDDKPLVEDKAPAPAKKKADTLDELLAEASAKPREDDAATAGATQESKKISRTELDGNDVKKAMKPVEGKARECYKKFQQPGLVMVKFGVDPSGKVTSATATGKFKDTDTGKCVASVVEAVTFPAYTGPPSSFSYAFLLSQ